MNRVTIRRNRSQNNWGVINPDTDECIYSFKYGFLSDAFFTLKKMSDGELIGVADGFLIDNPIIHIGIEIQLLRRLCFNQEVGFCDKAGNKLTSVPAIILGSDGSSYFLDSP